MSDRKRALQAVTRALAKRADSQHRNRRTTGVDADERSADDGAVAAEPAASQTDAPGEAGSDTGRDVNGAVDVLDTGSGGDTRPSQAQVPDSPELLDAYRALASMVVRLSDGLSAEDQLAIEARHTLAAAQRAWNAALFTRPPSSSSVTDPNGSPPDLLETGGSEFNAADEPPARPSSVELVPMPAADVDPPAPRLPDEAALVRYARRRRERNRLPDESTIGRYLRERRERGPRYPDEAAIKRYLRERRERP